MYAWRQAAGTEQSGCVSDAGALFSAGAGDLVACTVASVSDRRSRRAAPRALSLSAAALLLLLLLLPTGAE